MAAAWAQSLDIALRSWAQDLFGGPAQTKVHTRLHPCLCQAAWRKESFGQMYWSINCTSPLLYLHHPSPNSGLRRALCELEGLQRAGVVSAGQHGHSFVWWFKCTQNLEFKASPLVQPQRPALRCDPLAQAQSRSSLRGSAEFHSYTKPCLRHP